MDNVNNVSQADASKPAAPSVRTSITFPRPIWSEVKKAASNAGKPASQFVIDTMAAKVGLRAA